MKTLLIMLLVVGSYASAQLSTANTTVAKAKKAAATTTKKSKSAKKSVAPSTETPTEDPKLLALAESPQVEQAANPVQPATGSTSSTSASGTSTTTATAPTAPAAKYTGSLVLAAAAMVNDLKDKGSGALVDTSNTLTGLYTATDKIKVGASHNFAVRVIGDRSQLAGFNSDNGAESVYKTLDPTLNLNYKMQPLMGSNAYAILSKYYVPVTEESRAKESRGILRTQAYITWTMNPKIDISFFGQARLYLNSQNNTDANLGSDSVLRTIVGPVFGYNFNDVWNLYYNPYLDMRSSGYQRGKFDADVANGFSQDIGLWISLAGGKYVINPAWVTSASKLGKSTYEGAGDDSNSEYDLTLIAAF